MSSDKNKPAPEEVIQWRIAEWFPKLPTEVSTQLKSFHSELLKFNKTLNLISPKSIFVADNLHFADCINACLLLQNQGPFQTMYDLGSGNGFPGIIYAIFNPGVQVKLVDSDQRKCEFLKAAAAAVGLKNVEVLNKQVEDLPEKSVTHAIARGFAGLAKSCLITRKIFAKGGTFFHMKSEEWASEVVSMPTQLCTIWQPEHIGDYRLPMGEIKYALVKTIKIAD